MFLGRVSVPPTELVFVTLPALIPLLDPEENASSSL
jgi:hypothetical protein